MSEFLACQKSETVIDSDYDGLWTEDLLSWLMCWIDLVKQEPPVPVSQEINQE